jgi:hypothetical protein
LRAIVEMPGVGGIEDQLNEGQRRSWHILRGDPEEVKRDLERFQEAGLEYPVLWFVHANWRELEDSLRTFAAKIMPAFK